MDLDRFTAVLLDLRDDAPEMDDAELDALQDAHMAHLADLYDAGVLVAAGPLLDPRHRGLSILRGEPEDVAALVQADPSVRAGRLSATVVPWLVPAGVIAFPRGRLPRSMADLA